MPDDTELLMLEISAHRALFIAILRALSRTPDGIEVLGAIRGEIDRTADVLVGPAAAIRTEVLACAHGLFAAALRDGGQR